jgi:putative aldouronate transport system substrate-binding protein
MGKKFRKLLIALMLAFMLWNVAGAFALPDVPFAKSEKPLEFTMLYSDHPGYPYNEDWLLWKAIKERTNVTLKCVLVPMSDYVAKRSLLIAAADEPEILPKTYPGQETPFVASGEILAVSDYVNKMPNFMNKIKEWKMEPELNTLRQNDGKYYVLPGLHEKPNIQYSLAIRLDVFEQQKIPVPTTWDELYAALKKLKKAYPKSIPFSDSRNLDATLNFAASSFGAAWGYNYTAIFVFDRKNDKFVFSPTSDDYKTMVKYFAKLSKEELLDKESISQTTEMANNKFQTGSSFVINANFQDVIAYGKAMDTTLGAGKYKILKIPPPGGPKGHVVAGGARLENGIMISSKALKNPNFESMLKFIDWLWYSEEGQLMCMWGVEGTTYKMVNGKKQLMDDIFYQSVNAAKGTKDLRKLFGLGANGVLVYGGTNVIKTTWSSAADIAYYAEIDKTKTVLPLSPSAPMSDLELEEYNLKVKPLNDFVRTETLKFITNVTDVDKGWAAFVKACNDKGAAQLADNQNKYYMRAKK